MAQGEIFTAQEENMSPLLLVGLGCYCSDGGIHQLLFLLRCTGEPLYHFNSVLRMKLRNAACQFCFCFVGLRKDHKYIHCSASPFV